MALSQVLCNNYLGCLVIVMVTLVDFGMGK
jgi:hypothetical protein